MIVVSIIFMLLALSISLNRMLSGKQVALCTILGVIGVGVILAVVLKPELTEYKVVKANTMGGVNRRVLKWEKLGYVREGEITTFQAKGTTMIYQQNIRKVK